MNTWKPLFCGMALAFALIFLLSGAPPLAAVRTRDSNEMPGWRANSRHVLHKPLSSPWDALQLRHLLAPQSTAMWLLATDMALIPLL